MPRPDITYRYTFEFNDGAREDFSVTLDGDTLACVSPAVDAPPDWTRLDFHQCPNCPLEQARHPHCPVARKLVAVVEVFSAHQSTEPALVTVESRHRKYMREASLQTGVSSLLGLYMATSGCPVLDHLRPMVETHLPFMSREESMHRILSMHAIAQLFALRRGEPADLDLEGLRRLTDDLHAVNVAFCRRLRAISIKDAGLNAVVILDTLADFPGRRITRSELKRLEGLLKTHYQA